MKKGRLEAFSDGVFAILITILVLGLVPPRGTDLAALASVAPVFVAYLLSFVFLAIYWNNHHHMLQAADQVDGRVLWANLHLLFWLSLLPFVTGWMGENGFPPVPVAAYGVVCFGAGSAYFWLERTLVRLAPVDGPLQVAVGGALVKERLSLVAYAVSAAVAFVLPPLALAGYVGVAASWFIPDPRIERVIGQ
ncbi:MAG TPA: TMEM175 family protein [Candidatus Limnocylindrales bacterium]